MDMIPELQPFDRIARFYDADYRNHTDDLPLIVDLAQQAGQHVLELGCGTGRVLIPLAAVGCQVTGLDGSLALLDRARRKLQAAGYADRVTLVQGDLRTADLPRTDYDFACCVSNTLMHLTTQADQRAVLANARRHLRPGGHLLLDLFFPHIPELARVDGLQELADTWTDPETGHTVHKWIVRQTDVAHQWIEARFIYEEIRADGTPLRTEGPFLMRYLWPDELALLLEVAGFRVVEQWGDFDASPLHSASPRIITLAEAV